jgi:hypothetical protein
MARADDTANTKKSAPGMLSIYLNDHLAGSTAGTELARRIARSHQGRRESGVLEAFAEEVAQDRASLLDIMARLAIPVRGYKMRAAWIGEKAGRLKLNGYLLGRSPLSSLEELEMMRLAVEGKAAGWRTLRALAKLDARLDPAELDELLARAARQGELLEEFRVRAVTEVISRDRTVGDRAGPPEQAD